MYNIKFLETLVKEAFDAFGRGDKENGTALLNSFFDKMHPELVKDAMNDKRLILELILESTSKDKVTAFASTAMLNYLKEKGVDI